MCDHNKNLWDVYVNALGGTHDATHFRASSLYRSLMEREILQEPMVQIGNRQVCLYIVGDSSYPFLANIQKTYTANGCGRRMPMTRHQERQVKDREYVRHVEETVEGIERSKFWSKVLRANHTCLLCTTQFL